MFLKELSYASKAKLIWSKIKLKKNPVTILLQVKIIVFNLNIFCNLIESCDGK